MKQILAKRRDLIMNDWRFLDRKRRVAGKIGKLYITAPILEHSAQGTKIGTLRNNFTVVLK